MFKLYKRLSFKHVMLVLLIVALTVLQVYLTMTIVDYVKGIITAIANVNYHNNPGEIAPEFKAMVDTYGWETIKQMALSNSIPGMTADAQEMLIDIADATTWNIWYNGLMMLVFALGIMVVQAIIAICASFVAAGLSTKIRKELYEKVSNFSLAEIDNFSTASLITRATNDIQQIQMANLMTMRMIFQAPITAIWAIVKIQASSFELTMATVTAILLLVVVIGVLMFFGLPKFKIMQKLTDQLNQVTRDNLTGIRIVRAYNAEEYQEEKFDKANKDFMKAQLFTGRLMSLLNPFMMIIFNGLTLAMYVIGANLINNGEIDYSTVTSFVMLGSQLVMAFVMLLFLFILWPRALVAARRINEVLYSKPTIIEPTESKPFKEEGTIEFKNVSFKYPGSENDLLSDISFKVNKNETLAIVGATSSGKSTLINLMVRLYDVSSGEVLVDGVNVKELRKKDLIDKIGFVPQKGFLFNTSIKENIAFGSSEIDMAKVEKAAEISCSSEFINQKDEKYDFLISESGKNVSGGQRQRLCIARAVYDNPEILIFDDSFSALDYKTDRKLRDNLNEMDNKATKVIVAQRIGTIMDADKIIVLNEGKVVGIGNHKELLNTCELYKEIALSQLSREELGL